MSFDERLLLDDKVAVSTCVVQRGTTYIEADYRISCTVAIQHPTRDWGAPIPSCILQALKPRSSFHQQSYCSVVGNTQKKAKSIMLGVYSYTIPISSINWLHKTQQHSSKLEPKLQIKHTHPRGGMEGRAELICIREAKCSLKRRKRASKEATRRGRG